MCTRIYVHAHMYSGKTRPEAWSASFSTPSSRTSVPHRTVHIRDAMLDTHRRKVNLRTTTRSSHEKTHAARKDWNICSAREPCIEGTM